MHELNKLIDNGTHFEISISTKKVTVPKNHRVIGTVGSHMSEQVTFSCPIEIDGHDITQCARKYVAWRNALGDQGSDGLDLLLTENGKAAFAWDVKKGLTVGKGVVSFSIHFEDVGKGGELTYHWGTSTCSECEILDAINTVVGTYKSMYVVDETLVISDYNPVQDRKLELNSESIIPDGSMQITTNGNHNVRQYAEVNVNVPCDHDLTNLTPENVKKGVTINGVTGNMECIYSYQTMNPRNIRKGVTMHGVTGTYGGYRPIMFRVENNSSKIIKCVTSRLDADGNIGEPYIYNIYNHTINDALVTSAQDGFFVIISESGIACDFVDGTITSKVEGGIDVVDCGTNVIVFWVHGNDKDIVISDGKG